MRVWLAILASAFIAPGHALPQTSDDIAEDFRRTLQCTPRKTCGSAGSCREAVHTWCVCGYTRADADDDGVPCESLCGEGNDLSRARVRDIMAALECQRPR